MTAPKPRTMVCKHCGQVRPMKGWRSVMNVGRCCAVCVEQMRVAAVAKDKAAPARKKARPHADLGPWRPAKGISHMSEPAQRDPRAVQCPAPQLDHRYQAAPGEVTPMFSRLRPGQYQPGESWATKYVGEAA